MIPVRYVVRSLIVRKRMSAAAAVGIALVVFVMASALMLSNGIQETLALSGRAENAVVLRKGSDAELSSGIEDTRVGLVLAAPGVARGKDGQPLGSGDVVVVAAMNKIGTDGLSNVNMRGVTESAYEMRPDVRIVEGRPARPGTDEVVVGKRIRGRFEGVDLGQKFEIRRNRKVEVVGVFEANGSSFESEVWADRDTVRTAFGREGMVSSITVRLTDAAAYDTFEATVEQDKQLGLDAFRETTFFENQSSQTATFVTAIGIVITFFISLGAMIGAMITMYSQVAERRREVGVLRALGFSQFAVLTAFLLESVTLALVGGILGAAGSLCLGAVELSMVNFTSWSEIVFRFSPTPGILLTAVVCGAGMGLIGGFLPAVRAARLSPLNAIRA